MCNVISSYQEGQVLRSVEYEDVSRTNPRPFARQEEERWICQLHIVSYYHQNLQPWNFNFPMYKSCVPLSGLTVTSGCSEFTLTLKHCILKFCFHLLRRSWLAGSTSVDKLLSLHWHLVKPTTLKTASNLVYCNGVINCSDVTSNNVRHMWKTLTLLNHTLSRWPKQLSSI